MDKNFMIYAGVAFLFLCVVGAIFLFMRKKKSEEVEDPQDENQKTESPTFVLFWAKWCGNCTETMPIFQKMQNDSSLSNYTFIMREDSQMSKEYLEKQKITHYPTIRFYENGFSDDAPYKTFTGKRDEKNILDLNNYK